MCVPQLVEMQCIQIRVCFHRFRHPIAPLSGELRQALDGLQRRGFTAVVSRYVVAASAALFMLVRELRSRICRTNSAPLTVSPEESATAETYKPPS